MSEADNIHALGPPVTPRKISSLFQKISSFSNRPQPANPASLESPARQDSDPGDVATSSPTQASKLGRKRAVAVSGSGFGSTAAPNDHI